MTREPDPVTTVAPHRARSARWPLVLAIVLVGIPILVALLGPLLAPHDPNAPLGPPLGGPGTVGPLGTDELGRDVTSRVLSGGRSTVLIALAAATAAEIVGAIAGMVTALAGRPAATATRYLTRVLLAVPGVLLLSALVAGFGSSPTLLFAAAAIVLIPSLVPVIAARTRSLAAQPWMEAARHSGTGWPRLIVRELLPNLAPIMAADLATRFLTAVFLVSTAGFLGLGPAPPAPDWGVMISGATPTLQLQPWPVIAPATLLALLAIGVTLLTHRVIGRIAVDGADRVTGIGADGAHQRNAFDIKVAAAKQQSTADAAVERGGEPVPPVIRVTGLTITDPHGTEVLSGADLVVPRGGSVGILGPSGAGKTTLALALLGRLRPGLRHHGGTVTVDGIDMMAGDRRALQRVRSETIHYLPQDPLAALTPTTRLRTLLAEAIGPGPDRHATADALLRRVHLPDDPAFLRRRPHQLSGGQRQRLLLALAIAGPPAAIVLDEPTAGQDPATRDAIVDEIARLRDDLGVALITITHDFTVATRLADTVLTLEHGILAPHRQGQPAPSPTGRRPSDGTAPTGQAEVPALSVSGLSARLGTQTVLHEIDLAIRPGEIHAVIGRSGAGKTTLARVLAGLHPAAGGVRHVASPDPSTVRRRRGPAVGFVYQDPQTSLNPARAARAILADATGLRQRAAPSAADQLLVDVGLRPQDGRRRPGRLSGGQQQRVAIARALAAAPRVLICDEPTSALDPQTRDAICDLLLHLCRERGLAVLLVTHDLDAVRAIADHVLVLDRGRVVEDGTAAQILETPGHPVTRDLVGAAVMMPTIW